MSIDITELRKGFVLQDQKMECGVVCLQNIIHYYQGHQDLETLKIMSGTGATGTTFLGLYQAANEVGLDTEGCEMLVQDLVNLHLPAILHVQVDQGFYHYVVFYGCIIKGTQTLFIIGDPARGVNTYQPGEIETIWKSRACLVLTPGEHFKTKGESNQERFEWIKKIIRPDLSLLLIATIFGIVVSGLGLIMAIFSQHLIDEILPGKQLFKLVAGLSILLILLSFKEVIAGLRQFILVEQSRRFNTRVVDFFYSKLVRLKKSFFANRSMGEFTARLNDVWRIGSIANYLAGSIVIDCLVILASAVFIASYSFVIMTICFSAFPVFYFLVRKKSRGILINQKHVLSSYAFVETNYISTLAAIGTIKNHNKQSFFSRLNKRIYENYQEAVVSLGNLQIRISVAGGLFAVLFQVLIISYASHLVLDNIIKPGALIAIIAMSSSLLKSIASLALLVIPFSEASIAFERMREFTSLDPESEFSTPTGIEFKSLDIKNLSFRFRGRPLLLKNVSLSVCKGEIVGIVGANGSGKTTLVELIEKNILPETGEIIVNQEFGLDSVSLYDWRQIIALAPQDIHIFNGTVLENIAFEDAASRPQDIIRFLDRYEFNQFIRTLPQSFSTLLGEDGIKLSGGQKQLLGIARALYHRPQLLILDESTSFMEEQLEQFVMGLLEKNKNEMAILLITHHLRTARAFCDRIYRMNDGQLTKLNEEKWCRN